MKQRTAPLLSLLGISAVVALAACSSGTSDDVADEASQGATTRSHVTGRFALNLNGQFAGYIRSVSGGGIQIPQVDTSTVERVGMPRYGHIKMEIGFGMSPEVYDWIDQSWKTPYARKDGSIIAADFNLNAKSEREFFHALVTETVIPACDGASKEPGYMRVTFSPETVRSKAVDAGVKMTEAPAQKTFLPSNFRFELGDLDTKKVNKIDAITVRRVQAVDVLGNEGPPDTVAYSDVTVHLPEAEVAAWSKWLDASKAAGAKAEKKSGALVYLEADRQKELARLTLTGMGIFSITPDKAEANDDKIKRVTVRLRPESMSFKAPGVVVERDAGANR